MLKSVFLSLAITAPLLVSTPSAALDDGPDATPLSAAGDAAKGKRIFNRCKACHNLTDAKRPRLGPNLNGLFGRTAGSSESYTRYSDAVKNAGFVWTEEKLNEWLLAPRAFLPGNKMAFAGLRKEQDRKDLMAYLRSATETAE